MSRRQRQIAPVAVKDQAEFPALPKDDAITTTDDATATTNDAAGGKEELVEEELDEDDVVGGDVAEYGGSDFGGEEELGAQMENRDNSNVDAAFLYSDWRQLKPVMLSRELNEFIENGRYRSGFRLSD